MRLSYSSLNTYQQCPLKYKYREIDHVAEPKSKEQVFGTLVHSTMKFIHAPRTLSPSLEQALDYFATRWNSDVFDSPSEERAAFSQGVQMIQKYYQDNDISQVTVLDLESPFRIDIGDDDDRHAVSGIIDRIDKTPLGYEIIDYKTSRKMPSQQDIDNDIQLSIYLKAFLDRYPKERERLDTITVSLYFLKHGVKLSSTRTTAQLEQVERLFLDVIHEIADSAFAPMLSPLCDWCGYKKICPMWRHQFTEERKIDTTEANAAIEEYLALRSRMGSDKKRLGELQEKIIAHMDSENVERLFSPHGIIARTIRKTYAYDADAVRHILAPIGKWDSVVKIDGIALGRLLSSLPLPLRKELEKTKKIEKESRALTVKKTDAL